MTPGAVRHSGLLLPGLHHRPKVLLHLHLTVHPRKIGGGPSHHVSVVGVRTSFYQAFGGVRLPGRRRHAEGGYSSAALEPATMKPVGPHAAVDLRAVLNEELAHLYVSMLRSPLQGVHEQIVSLLLTVSVRPWKIHHTARAAGLVRVVVF